MNKLRSESEQREVSLNTLVNQILKRYVEWDLYEPKVGMIPLAKPIVVEMFQKMNEDEIVDIARRIGKNAVKDIALFMKGKIDVNSFLSWFESRMKTSSVELNHMIENDSHTYNMKHDLGENWSFYHKNLLELIFNKILGKSIDINISNTTVMFKFKE